MPDLAEHGPWIWLILGLALVALETLAPGVFLVWFGIAAILTGVADWAFGLAWQANLILFAALAVAAALVGRRLMLRPGDRPPTGPGALNRRGEALVGRTFLLERPIVAGEGQVRVDDSVWRVTGPDVEAGHRVRVLQLDGATLVVEAA